ITDNESVGAGGGVFLIASGGLLLRSEVSDNRARGPHSIIAGGFTGACGCDDIPAIGGGVLAAISLLGAVNSTISGNVADLTGGGLVSALALSLVVYSTIADNEVVAGDRIDLAPTS